MAFNGSGVFQRLYNWVTDRNATIKIQASRMDNEMDGFATGLSTCITKDGQTTIAADIPFNSKKITGLGNATADAEALNRLTGDKRYGNADWVDVASAGTTDIGAATSANVNITGTTTITGLGTVAAGTFRRLKFAGSLTLTYNATSLILPGKTNIATSAGDVLTAISEGSGNWRVLSYTYATGGLITTEDAATNTVTRPFGVKHSTTGTAAVGYGTGFILQGEDAAGNVENMALIDAVWTDATNGSEDSVVKVYTKVNGTDTLGLTVAGTGVVGTTTNDSATAGNVGEIIESEVLVGSAVGATSATPLNVTSISLTAGDWDVWADVATNPAGANNQTVIQGSISTTSATHATIPNKGAYVLVQTAFAVGAGQVFPVGMKRLSLSGTTTVYLVATVTWTTSTLGVYGYLGARRVR